jgi:hypothetical protein
LDIAGALDIFLRALARNAKIGAPPVPVPCKNLIHCEDPLPRNAQPVDVDGPYYDFNADVDLGRLTYIPVLLSWR